MKIHRDQGDPLRMRSNGQASQRDEDHTPRVSISLAFGLQPFAFCIPSLLSASALLREIF